MCSAHKTFAGGILFSKIRLRLLCEGNRFKFDQVVSKDAFLLRERSLRGLKRHPHFLAFPNLIHTGPFSNLLLKLASLF